MSVLSNQEIKKIDRRQWGSLIMQISSIAEVNEKHYSPKNKKTVRFENNNPMIEALMKKMQSRQAKFQKKWNENKQKLIKDKVENYSFHPTILRSKKKKN
jgi:hypothetical protein